MSRVKSSALQRGSIKRERPGGESPGGPEYDPGEVTIEDPEGLAPGLALGAPAGDEDLRRRMVPERRDRDRVDRSVELAVAASVEARPTRLARATRPGRGPGWASIWASSSATVAVVALVE